MIVFERSTSSQSTSTAERTVAPAIREVLRTRFADAGVVGVIAATGWPLIQTWQACLDEGREPIILHFPTPKLSRVYWRDEINFAVGSAGVTLLICQNADCVPPECSVPVMLIDDLKDADAAGEAALLPETGSIIQMSSGTTGHRKSIRFDFGDVRTHAADYNQVLGLTPDDCIVSWLPLYHDMGFVAAFLMPRLLGCKIVMLDPVEWVRRPEMLWEAIEEHGGTIVYMPNFGFEVMAARPRPMPTVRRWISCSEPTRKLTMERFGAAVQAEPRALANCWGMAENIFAVCISDGITTRTIDDTEVVSCGRPIPGVEVKSVDGEIFVRSPYSLREYIGFPITLDDEGFYGSGDLGVVEDGEIFLLGRKHDVINVAGRKSLASDVDYVVAQAVPESAGRIATFALLDPDLGTDVPFILIEHPQFWRKERDGELRRRIVASTGIESARVHFVPPRFITKTSSGKVNRKTTRAHWQQRAEARAAGAAETGGPAVAQARAEIAELFPWLDHAVPVGEQIDSLGFVNLSLVLERFALANGFSPEMTLGAALADDRAEPSDERNVVKIVSIADANVFRVFAPAALEMVRSHTDRPIQFRHLCVPPLPILLSDLIFVDYFMARDHRGHEPYSSLIGTMRDVREANVLIVDEAQSIFFPRCNLQMSYPRISHDFISDEDSKYLGVRWARYSEGHHGIACHTYGLQQSRASEVNSDIDDISDYLGIPVVRVAYGRSNAEITNDWEVQGGAEDVQSLAVLGSSVGINYDKIKVHLAIALGSAILRAPERWSIDEDLDNWNDQPHWCSWLVNPEKIDFILERFSCPVVLGKPASVPYLAERARELGISLAHRQTMDIPEECDCVILNGFWGEVNTDKPVFHLMSSGSISEGPVNVGIDVVEMCPPSRYKLIPFDLF